LFPPAKLKKDVVAIQGMLTRLTKRLRFYAAMVLAAVYGVCVVAPAVAMALASGAAGVHCLTDEHHGNAHVHIQSQVQSAPHVHDDGTAHEHDHGMVPATDGDSQSSFAGTCCGLFCFSAVTGDVDAIVDQHIHASRVVPALDGGLDGRGPDRINRPPISPLSL
jgi:hypothetical protein